MSTAKAPAAPSGRICEKYMIDEEVYNKIKRVYVKLLNDRIDNLITTIHYKILKKKYYKYLKDAL